MEDIKVVLDLGNRYIKWAVYGQEEGKHVVLAKEMVKTKWMRKWKILDLDDFTLSINSVLDSFVKKLWEHFFEEICLWVSHPEMNIKRISEQKRILNPNITQEDLDHLLNVINDSSWESNYETIKIIPVQWIIDDQLKVKDPIWMEWRKIELIADVFMVPKNFYNSVTEVFEKLQIDIWDVVPNILWASEVALDFDSKDLGTLLIDIWNNQTSYAVYEEWYPLLYGILPFGWEEVTKDISIGLQIDINEAEKIKREKWVISLEDPRSKDEDSIDVSFLSDILTARYEEIFEKINEVLVNAWRDWKLPWGVILVWWWAKVKNIEKLSKEIFKLASFTWKDKILNVWELSNNLQFISLNWCYYWYMKYSEEWWKGFSFGMDFGFVKKIWKFIKDLF